MKRITLLAILVTLSVSLAQAASALNATGLGSQAGVVSLEATLAFMKSCSVKAA